MDSGVEPKERVWRYIQGIREDFYEQMQTVQRIEFVYTAGCRYLRAVRPVIRADVRRILWVSP